MKYIFNKKVDLLNKKIKDKKKKLKHFEEDNRIIKWLMNLIDGKKHEKKT